MAKQYVQHISGQGEKWGVDADCNTGWRVRNPAREADWYLLSKSEYRLCEPPVVQWKDVTAECEIDEEGAICHRGGFTTMIRDGYRRRKVTLWATDGAGGKGNCSLAAIIVEQKVG